MIKYATILFIAGMLLGAVGCQSGAAPIEQSTIIVSPWAGFAVGSYVHYRIPLSGGAFNEEKHTVVEAKPNHVTIEISSLVDDEWQVARRIIVPLKTKGVLSNTKIEDSDRLISVGAKQVKCKIETKDITDPEDSGKKVISRTWISDEVPGGLVRIAYNDTVVMEAVEFEKK